MISRLRQHLASPDLPAQLGKLAAGAPASAPVSLTLELGSLTTDWLTALPADVPFWYLARPTHGLHQLGIGHALHVASAGANRFAALDSAFSGFARHWRHNGTPLAFCGFAFDEHSQAPLPNALLAIPAILLESRDGNCRATLSVPAGKIDCAPAHWAQLLARPLPLHAQPRLPPAERTLADRAWVARVNAALRDIADGRFAKVVLCRNLRFTADRPLCAGTLLGRLIEQQAAGLIYAHGHGSTVFLGATPERLVRLAGRQIATDALAGTAWPGSLDIESPKNRHEQSLVVRAILAALESDCIRPPQAGPVEVQSAGNLRHLRSPITGEAAAGVSLFDLLRAVHPTPAVGGFPRPAALDWLARHGEQRSAWYSGGLGSITPQGDGEFSVALRSALIRGSDIELQAGAGIVSGSDAQLELAETDAKIGTLLAALSDQAKRAHGRLA